VFVRGRPEDFARWVAAGADGWGWDDVKPYYERVPVMTYPSELWMPLDRLLVEGMQELGFRYVEDMDDPSAWDGVVGPWPRNRHNEIRQGSNVTHLRHVRALENFVIYDRAVVDRVLIDGARAVGVRWVDRQGRGHEARGGHVILSAGSYGSAPILLRSGVGPADELRALGLEPRLDLPVGRALMDHPATTFVFRLDPAHIRLGWPVYAAVGRGRGWWTLGVPLDQESGLAALSMCRARPRAQREV
jgi:choline dehydrogenase